jgi:LuxR family transcriptional regulator, maltose regulon positive regulatory protein
MNRSAQRPILLEGRFRPQLGAREQVARARLPLPSALLDGPVRCVTVIAPAGYGKSTLMAQWHEALVRTGVDAAWLNLDANDNHPARLLRNLCSSLGRQVAGLEQAGAGAIAAQSTDVPLALETLGSALAAHARPLVLFLDDAQEITNPEAQGVLRWLFANSGVDLRCVVGSRHAVGWASAELRLRGQLLEFDQQALAFDADEVREFCRSRLAEALDGAAVDRLLHKTEGWPAAMELVTLALNDASDPGHLVAQFATTDRGILEFLGDAVFGRLPAGLRQLAHEVAQFDRYSTELIAAASDGRASPGAFGELLRRQLFVIPLDRQGRWFRFHHLVGDYLRRHDPRPAEEIAVALVRGGRWLHEHGTVDDAIDCAVRAGEWELACQWLDRAAEDAAQRRGDGANLLRWLSAIPGPVLDRYPRIRLSQVFSLVFNRRTPEIERELRELEALAARLPSVTTADPQAAAELGCAVPALRMMWEALRDEVVGLRGQAERWLGTCPDARPHYVGEVCNVAAFACKTEGDIEAGLAYCDRGESAHASDDNQFGVSWARVLRALLLLKRGDFRAALAAADAGLQHVDEQLHGHPELAAYLQAVRAAVWYEFDEPSRAAEALEAHPDALDDRGSSDFVLLTHLTRARLQLRAGHADEGLAALELGRKAGHRLGLRRVIVTLAGEQCIWLCRLGRYDEAVELARAQDFDRTLHPRYDVVADKAARIAPRLLMRDRPELAVAQLGAPLLRATEKGFHHRRVEMLLLHASALLRAGRGSEALQSWRIALDLGERQGYRRVFLDDMDLVDPLLQAARSRDDARVPAWLRASPPRGGAGPEEPLTRKELRIVRHLATGASNREIAALLFVSEGTLKWHLHNVYRKLACRNRSGAIAAARRQGLL